MTDQGIQHIVYMSPITLLYFFIMRKSKVQESTKICSNDTIQSIFKFTPKHNKHLSACMSYTKSIINH